MDGIPVIISVIFVIVFAAVIVTAVRGLLGWASNNAKPVLTARARVTGKRTRVTGGGEMRSHTSYYATFELAEDRTRHEFKVSGKVYGTLLAFRIGHSDGTLSEGDEGDITYQGTRYHGFSRS